IPEGTLPQQIILTVENCGQTPAYEVQAVTNWWHGIGEPPPNFDFPDFEGAGTGPRSIGSLYSGKPMSFSFALDPTLYLNAQLGTAALFCYGHVDYRDVFGHQWSTRYCYVVLPNRGGVGGAFTQYQRHNDAT
ncbi:MAG TPA: hypothetical protein VH184_10270, partial [Dongiaceae bacterium]|nr:hypothetical protein [Dongiaceae bacterium]